MADQENSSNQLQQGQRRLEEQNAQSASRRVTFQDASSGSNPQLADRTEEEEEKPNNLTPEELQQLNDQICDLRDQLDDQNVLIRELRSQLRIREAGAVQEVRELESQLASLQEDLDKEREARANLNQEPEELIQICDLRDQLDDQNVLIRELRSQLRIREEGAVQEVRELESQLASLQEDLDAEREARANLNRDLQELSNRLQDSLNLNTTQQESLTQLQQERDALNQSLETLKSTSSPYTKNKLLRNCFVIIRKNYPDDDEYPYYSIRVQRRRLRKTMRRLSVKYPDLEIIYEKEEDPNSINLFNLLEEEPSRPIKRNGNHFSTTLSEEELKQVVDGLYN